ncbi:unnamed protein product, partial [Rotaria magnacalcarata]
NHIFTVFINLTHLTFYDAAYENNVRLLFDVPFPTFSSSSLSVLNIKVQTFDVCLYILDGRFEQLHTLDIELANLFPPLEEIENQRKLPNLKYFVLCCMLQTSKELGLTFTTTVDETFIDGNNLKQHILNHMSQLKRFTFDIRSVICINNEMNLPSKEDIQQTFTDLQYTKIVSCVDYFLDHQQGLCHIYSYPFLMRCSEYITNNYAGGLYPYARVVSLYDEHPFEHEVFIRISQSFPCMEKLTINNRYGQNQKESYRLMNDKANL